MAAVWQLIHIRARVDGDRATVDPNGSWDILHWADVELARAWIRQASAAIDPQRVRDADAGGHAAQVALLVAVTFAIANAYNAMNILWENDPLARMRYRASLSGPPASSSSEYSAYDNYGGGHWYRANESFPTAGGIRLLDGEQVHAEDFTGSIPMLARQIFLQDYPLGRRVAEMHPSEFRQSVGVYVDSQGRLDAQGRPADVFEDVRTSRNRINRPFVMGDLPQEILPGTDPSTGRGSNAPLSPENWCRTNRDFECPRWISPAAFMGFVTGVVTSGGGVLCGPAPPRRADETAVDTAWGAIQRSVTMHANCANLDWHYGMFVEALRITTHLALVITDDLNPFVPLPVWAPLRAYLPWLQAWIGDLESRSPEQIIVDSRKFVIQQNLHWIQNAGGPDAFYRQLLAGQENRAADQGAADPNVQMAAAAVGAIGAALAGATYGISAVAGAVIGAGLTIWDASRTHDVAPDGNFKDDLGRYKPSFALGWLGGLGPGFPGEEGHPDNARLPIPDPPGFQRGGRPTVQGPNAGQTYLSDLGMGCDAWARISDPAARTIRLRSASVNRGIDPAEGDRRRVLVDAYCASQGAQVRGAVNPPVLNIMAVLTSTTPGKGVTETATQTLTSTPAAPPSTTTPATSTTPALEILPAHNEVVQLTEIVPAPRKVWPWVVGGVVVLGAGAGGYWWLHRDKRPHQ